MSITFKSFTILLILALSCVVGAQDENSISTAELMELSSISEVQYENAMSTAPIIEPPSVYIPASVNVEDNHNLLIGGISQSRILGENPALIEFADNNHAVYVPTYYLGNIPSDFSEVAKASGSKYIPTFENGLARTELQYQYYNTIFAYSGGTRTVVTAIDRQGVTAEKLVLISPMRATQSQDDYDRTIQRILNDGLVNKIEVWQSPQDQLPLVEFNQVRFEEGVDLDITVHSIDLDSEGISAHIELFSYVSGVYSGSPSVLALDVSPRSPKCGDSLAITYTVLDNSGSGLKQVELWRKDETSDWQEIERYAPADVSGLLSGSFTDSPPSPGTWWYGVHVADNAGNWNDQRNSNTNYQPVSFEPVEVEVKAEAIADVSPMDPGKDWNKTFGGSQEDKAYSVQPTSDGGYVLAGYTFSDDTWSRDGWLIKTDSNGNELWERTFGSGVIDEVKSVQPTNDDGFVLVGFTNLPRDQDAWIIRTDGDGHQIWNRTIGSSNLEEANAVQQTSDGGYVIAGSIEHWLSPGYFYLSLIKMDSNGNELWQKTFGGEATYEQANSVLQTSDGGYVLAGVTESFGSGGKDAWLIKTDSYGDAIWHMTFGGSDDDWSNSVQQTSDGGYILAGVTSDDAWLIKTDSDGNELWQRTFGEHPRVNWAHSVQQTADGGYVLAGVSGYYEWSEGECIGDAWLIKTDSDGNKLWQRTFGDPGAESRVYSVQLTSDGSYILAGVTNDNAWLIKVASC